MIHHAPHQVVCFGEILWDILPTGAKPGGAPMNVAYHLRQLGYQPALITRIGNDDYGGQLLTLLTQYGVDTAYIQTDKHHNTGLVYAQPGAQHEMTYDIVYPAAWDYIQWHQTLELLVQQAAYFVYGSLVTRNGTSKNTLFRLLEMAPKRVLDINLRTPFYSQAIVEQLLQRVDILKLNE